MPGITSSLIEYKPADLFRFQRLNRCTLSLTTYTEMILEIVATKVKKHARTWHYKSVAAIQVDNTSVAIHRLYDDYSANTRAERSLQVSIHRLWDNYKCQYTGVRVTTSVNTLAESPIHRPDDHYKSQYKDRMMTTSGNTPAEGSLQVRIYQVQVAIHRGNDHYKC
jgi:hypothetical protein